MCAPISEILSNISTIQSKHFSGSYFCTFHEAINYIVHMNLKRILTAKSDFWPILMFKTLHDDIRKLKAPFQFTELNNQKSELRKHNFCTGIAGLVMQFVLVVFLPEFPLILFCPFFSSVILQLSLSLSYLSFRV